jgi:hypothetical protein
MEERATELVGAWCVKISVSNGVAGRAGVRRCVLNRLHRTDNAEFHHEAEPNVARAGADCHAVLSLF